MNIEKERAASIDKVARAMAQSIGWYKWDTAKTCGDTHDGSDPDDERDYWRGLARVSIEQMGAIVVEQEPVALQHVAVAEKGILRWMTGRKMQDCELYVMLDGKVIHPQPSADDARDAARYRWLRHGDNDELVLQRGPIAMDYVYLPRNSKLDEMIDAAMKGAK